MEYRISQYAGTPVEGRSHAWRYLLTGNTLLAPARLRKILDSALDPRQAVAEVLGAYRNAGYMLAAITARVLPVSTVANGAGHGKKNGSKGRVHLYVVEGRITDERIVPEVRIFFGGLKGKPALTRDQFIRRLVLANEYAPRIGLKLRPTLKPAEQPGGSELVVSGEPLPGFKRFSGSMQIGNYGSRYLSTYVTGGNVTLLPGAGLELNANYLTGLPNWTKESRGSVYRTYGIGVSSVTPWGTYGVTARATHYRLGQVADPLNNTGDVTTVNLTGQQLLFATIRSQFKLAEGFHRVLNRITVFKGSFTLTDQRYDYFSLGFDLTQGYSLGGFNGGLSLVYRYNRGVSPRRGTLARYTGKIQPTPDFGYHTLHLIVQQQLPKGFLARVNLDGQWADVTLPQQQQWVLGGLNNLTAYRGGIILGDSGYALRLLLQAPFKRLGFLRLSPNVFLENGGARHRYVPGSWRSVTDGGAGLTAVSRFGTLLSLAYAIPIARNGIPNRVADAQRAGVYFVLRQSF